MALSSSNSSSIQYAALVLRRKRKKEHKVYKEIQSYSSADYEVLLKHWTAEPFLYHLSAITISITSTDPEECLLTELHEWTSKLGATAGYSNLHGIRGVKTVFLTMTGSGSLLFPQSLETAATTDNDNMFLTYIIPTTCKASKVVSCYPTDDATNFCQFYCLQEVLNGMYSNKMNIHPSTKEMLSALDSWLNDFHSQPHSLNQLFKPPITQRAIGAVTNPFYTKDIGSELFEKFKKTMEEEKVDKFVDNPFFGQGLKYDDKPDRYVVNQYFGMGKPDYEAIGTKSPQDNMENGVDWTDQFPLHKYSCEGDIDGIRQCMMNGTASDPNVLDSDGWAPLHYACWYGELDVVTCLVDECVANVSVQNTNGSTPLHIAAGNGHRYIVDYLLKCPGINPGAVDFEGRTPMRACLESKSNDWKATERLLQDSLDGQEHVDTPRVASKRRSMIVLHNERGELSEEEEEEEEKREQHVHYEPIIEEPIIDQGLELRGSLADIMEDGTSPVKPSTVRKVDISFMNGHHQVTNFYKGKITPALDALQDVFTLIRLEFTYQFVFALWVVSKHLAIQLGDTDKPLKIIARWPSLMKRLCKSDSKETPRLYLRRNVFLAPSRETLISDPVALQYLYFDALNHVLSGYYPTNEEEALELASITMQLKYGDFNSSVHNQQFIKDRLMTLAPSPLIKGKRKVQFERRFLAYCEQQRLREHNSLILYNKYLDVCRKWPYYGASFYEGNMTTKINRVTEFTLKIKPVRKLPVRIGVNAFGFHFINKETNVPMESYPLDDMRWDRTEDSKDVFNLETLDSSLTISVSSKQAQLLDSLSTQMKREFDTIKIQMTRH